MMPALLPIPVVWVPDIRARGGSTEIPIGRGACAVARGHGDEVNSIELSSGGSCVSQKERRGETLAKDDAVRAASSHGRRECGEEADDGSASAGLDDTTTAFLYSG